MKREPVHHKAPAFDWPDDAIAKLREMAAAAMKTNVIAEKLSKEFQFFISRNAVIGKMNRLGIGDKLPGNRSSKPRGPQANERSRNALAHVARRIAAAAARPIEHKPEPKPDTSDIPETKEESFENATLQPFAPKAGVEFLDLLHWHCRAPLDRRGSDGLMMSCGDPKTDGSSYCREHHGLYVGAAERRMR